MMNQVSYDKKPSAIVDSNKSCIDPIREHGLIPRLSQALKQIYLGPTNGVGSSGEAFRLREGENLSRKKERKLENINGEEESEPRASLLTCLAAILCIAVNILSAVRSFKNGSDVFDGIFRCYAVLIALFRWPKRNGVSLPSPGRFWDTGLAGYAADFCCSND
ncbi:hypothetical protein K1719_043204 [Acacia pycnantha]|nr:hypothetical protein K1719_043204 [Acacia pycnantha]